MFFKMPYQKPYQLSLCSLTLTKSLSACIPVFKQSLNLWGLYWESTGLSGIVCNFSSLVHAQLTFPARSKAMSWTTSMARERQQHRQPQYPVEDHDTVEAERFYSLDALQHCIKIKDLNVAYIQLPTRQLRTESRTVIALQEPAHVTPAQTQWPSTNTKWLPRSHQGAWTRAPVNTCITGILQAGLGTKG